MRTYELVFVVDPRLADEDVVALSDEYRSMIESGGGSVIKQESWGKKRLAYPIENANEGKYILFHLEIEGDEDPLPLVEQRMRQNDKVFRYLTVRTDKGRRRGSGPKNPPVADPAPAATEAPAEGAVS